MRVPRTCAVVSLAVVFVLVSCGADPNDALVTVPATTVPATTVPATTVPATVPATTTIAVTATTLPAEPEITIPPGILAAMPFQNRLDVPAGIFQVKLYNGTDQRFDIVGVQLLWDGLTTPVSPRANPLIAGDRLDYPVPLAPATCAGDGTVADMPDPNKAVVRVLLADGSEVQAPVFDVLHFARTLYLQDCERQMIDSQVAIEWVGLHAQELDGREVTDGTLRLTRRDGTGEITILRLGNNILFTFGTLAAGDGPVAVLPAGEHEVSVPIRFTEGRCDAHAMSESSQPFQFSATLTLGDGVERGYAMPIPLDDQLPMRARLEAACEYLGETGTFNDG